MKIDMDALKRDFVKNITEYTSEQAKKKVVEWIQSKAIPTLRDMANAWVDEVKKSAEGKKVLSWVHFRDTVFLPAAVYFGLWVLENFSSQIIGATTEDTPKE